MKQKTALFIFIAYLYLLTKIILFKFQTVSAVLLGRQLNRSFNEPAAVYHRLLHTSNIIPFHEILRSISHVTGSGTVNLVGNIVLFLPFGFLLPFVRSQHDTSWRKAFGWSILLSLGFETAQGVLAIGTFDVDDIILNTFGGWLGYGLFWLLHDRRTAARVEYNNLEAKPDRH